MKTLKPIFLLILLMLGINSCSNLFESQADPADAFVGDYEVTENYYIRIGTWSKTSSLTGKIRISKASENTVRMSGMWSTTGVIEGNILYLQDCSYTDETGYTSYSFSSGYLSRGKLTFSYTSSGVYIQNGVSYAVQGTGNIVANKRATPFDSE